MNKSGVTFINLVVMITVMIILISVAGYYSLDGIKNSYTARRKKELSNVVEYVSVLRAKLLNDEFEVKQEPIDPSALLLVAEPLSEASLNAIIDVNSFEKLDKNYKYVYVKNIELGNKEYSDGDIVVKDAKYNYIINFFTGTVIALYEDSNYEVSGVVKDLSTILSEKGA